MTLAGGGFEFCFLRRLCWCGLSLLPSDPSDLQPWLQTQVQEQRGASPREDHFSKQLQEGQAHELPPLRVSV